MGRNRRTAVAVVVGLLVAALAAPAAAQTKATPTSPDAKPLDSTVKVTITTQPSLNAAPLYLAAAKGYFKAEKLDVEIVNAGSGSSTQPLIATGRLDAAYNGASAAFFNGVANGQEVAFVGAAGESQKGGANSALAAKVGGPVKSIADLRGRKVSASAALAGTSGFYVAEILKQGGLTMNDVTVVNLVGNDALAALKNGAVSAALLSGTLLTEQLKLKQVFLVGDMDKVLRYGSGGGFIFGPSLLRKNRRAGVALLRALTKAVRKDLQGDWLKNKQTVQILSQATSSPTWVIKQTVPPVFDPDPELHPEVFDNMQRYFRDNRQLGFAPNLKIARYLDLDLVRAAKASYK